MEADKSYSLGDELGNEVFEISKLIRDTPKADKPIVDDYHKEIIQRIDHNKIIVIPSMEHRQLHQQIWLMSFTIYNSYSDINKACIDFMSKPTKDKKGEYPSERVRFDIYYDKFYVKPHLESLEKEEKRIKWAKDIDANIRKDTEREMHKSLEEVTISID